MVYEEVGQFEESLLDIVSKSLMENSIPLINLVLQ